ncbi:hypothetical protein I4F81_001602 [Pyropia yezoensis]|uniref:Uncharacterized protein n=1 Tax=Pyropia yezoensis TaxID=2788 RepID=A0ACC3BN25_PYRYE|nr:hypothetical protein I4F81_001602 [Neopyropia yezoensis]
MPTCTAPSRSHLPPRDRGRRLPALRRRGADGRDCASAGGETARCQVPTPPPLAGGDSHPPCTSQGATATRPATAGSGQPPVYDSRWGDGPSPGAHRTAAGRGRQPPALHQSGADGRDRTEAAGVTARRQVPTAPPQPERDYHPPCTSRESTFATGRCRGGHGPPPGAYHAATPSWRRPPARFQ